MYIYIDMHICKYIFIYTLPFTYPCTVCGRATYLNRSNINSKFSTITTSVFCPHTVYSTFQVITHAYVSM